MKYYIINADITVKQGHFGVFNTEQEAQAQADKMSLNEVIVFSSLEPTERVLFEKVGNNWQDSLRELSQREKKILQNWIGLEDALELTQLVDSADTFFQRAITTTNVNAYALLLNCFGANRWDVRLAPALQMVKDALPVPLTANELNQLNQILSDNNFEIVIV